MTLTDIGGEVGSDFGKAFSEDGSVTRRTWFVSLSNIWNGFVTCVFVRCCDVVLFHV